MTLLAPAGLLALVSLGVLVWLWRMTATRRRIVVSSLVPFERLLRRPPPRRSRLVINLLFWLQAAALMGLGLAMAQPRLPVTQARTILAVLDTSASLSARVHGRRVFERAKEAMAARLARTAAGDRVLLMTTAPVLPAVPQPTGDLAALRQAVAAAPLTHLGGTLGTTVRVGQALLGRAPDRTLIVTDEPRPPALPPSVTWVSVGAPAANAAIVGLDAQGLLCQPGEPRVVATVQNFSSRERTLVLMARQERQRLATARVTLAAHAHAAVALALPAQTQGWIEVALVGAPDALEADDRAWVELRRGSAMPIVVQTRTPAITEVVSTWLSACQALQWSVRPTTPDAGPILLITDHEDATTATAAAVLRLQPPARLPLKASGGQVNAHPVASAWIVSSSHPVGAYLSPVSRVSAALTTADSAATPGTPVVVALLNGRQVPVVVADEPEGRRRVTLLFDPAGLVQATPVVVIFFNSVRWLLGHEGTPRAGEPLVAHGFAAGRVSVARPDGTTDTVLAEHGMVRYDRATLAGRYRFVQGATTATQAASCCDPLESNLEARASTWYELREPAPRATPTTPRSTRPLAPALLGLALLLLVVEWWRYCVRTQALEARGSRFEAGTRNAEPPAQHASRT